MVLSSNPFLIGLRVAAPGWPYGTTGDAAKPATSAKSGSHSSALRSARFLQVTEWDRAAAYSDPILAGSAHIQFFRLVLEAFAKKGRELCGGTVSLPGPRRRSNRRPRAGDFYQSAGSAFSILAARFFTFRGFRRRLGFGFGRGRSGAPSPAAAGFPLRLLGVLGNCAVSGNVVVHIPAGALELQARNSQYALKRAFALRTLNFSRGAETLNFFKAIPTLGTAIWDTKGKAFTPPGEEFFRCLYCTGRRGNFRDIPQSTWDRARRRTVPWRDKNRPHR